MTSYDNSEHGGRTMNGAERLTEDILDLCGDGGYTSSDIMSALTVTAAMVLATSEVSPGKSHDDACDLYARQMRELVPLFAAGTGRALRRRG